MKINEGNIKEMLQKYMDGMTSVDEEQMLAQYFRKAGRKAAPESIAEDDWQAYKEMFAMFDSGKQSKQMWLRWCAAAAVMVGIVAGAWLFTGIPEPKPTTSGEGYTAIVEQTDSMVQNTSGDSTKIEILPTQMPMKTPATKKKAKSKRIRSTSMPIPRHYIAETKTQESADTTTVNVDDAVRQAELLMLAVFQQQQIELNTILHQGCEIIAGLNEYISDNENEEYEEIDVY